MNAERAEHRQRDPVFTYQITSGDAAVVLSDQPTGDAVSESGRWIAAKGLWDVRP